MIVIVPFRRSPEAAKGWLLLIFFEPTAGLLLYLLIGRPSLPAWRMQRSAEFDAHSKPTYERLIRDPNIFHPDLGAGLDHCVRLAENLGELPILGGNAADVIADYDGTDRSSHRGHRRRARSRASALLHHRRRRDGGTRRRCARPRGRPRSCVPRASGLAGVAPCFRPSCCRDCTSGASSPRRRCASACSAARPAASTCATIARSRSSTAPSPIPVRRISWIRRSSRDSTTRNSTSASRARSRSNCRRSSPKTGTWRPASFSATPTIFRSRASPAAFPRRRCRAVRAIRVKTTSA